MTQAETDLRHMLRACKVAARAIGFAEPNPTVGCVIAIGDEVLAEGWTQEYGSHHAEVHALNNVSDEDRERLHEATMYVTLEPCCHQGKTPPCTNAILSSPIRRVVIAVEDPFPQVAGKGIDRLRDAGAQIEIGVAAEAATRLFAPYLKLQRTGRPWVIAKWAMTLDGKMATAQGDSQWISSPTSRKVVHEIRGRVDGVMVGIGTAFADDPQLTARPAGPRTALRIVFDSTARLPTDSQLATTAHEHPVLLAVGPTAPRDRVDKLSQMGVEILSLPGETHELRLQQLLQALGQRRLTNLLVEGGGDLLGGLFDGHHVDEVHAFVAPKIAGGRAAIPPVGGAGVSAMAHAGKLDDIEWTQLESDIYIKGRVRR